MEPGTVPYLVSVATKCSQNQNTQEYNKLSSLMCWDAAVHCAVLAGMLRKSLVDNKNAVTSDSPPVTGKTMGGVQAGSLLGFFNEDKAIVHMMVYLGNMEAGGNKNDCVGIGRPVGWEVLNLSTLKWQDDGSILAPGLLTPTRKLIIRHRPLSQIG